MKIGIQLDRYVGYLFHNVEMLMILFDTFHDYYGGMEITYVLDTTDQGRLKCDIGNLNRFKKIKHNVDMLCDRLFDVKHVKLEMRDGNVSDFDFYLCRYNLNTKNINKAFAENILSFPCEEWHKRLTHNKKPTRGLLYSCRQDTMRKLTSQDANKITKIVSDFGGTTVSDLGRFTVLQQIDLFNDHTCLLGLHGSNLTGSMWMSPGCMVIELLRTTPYIRDVYDYQALSWCMNHRYTQLLFDGGAMGAPGSKCNLTLSEDMYNLLDRNLTLWKQLYC